MTALAINLFMIHPQYKGHIVSRSPLGLGPRRPVTA